MKKSKKNEIRRMIDRYLRGHLNEEQSDALWVEFAKNPELLDVLEVEVGLKRYFMDKLDAGSENKEDEDSPVFGGFLISDRI